MYNLNPRSSRLSGRRWLLAVILVSATIGCNKPAESGSQTASSALEAIPGESVAQLHAQRQEVPATFVLDVRTAGEFDGPLGHIDGARLIPVQELSQRLAELQDVKQSQIHVVCRSGNRSARATKILLEAGFDAVNVEGGMRAWRQAYPMSN